MMMMMHLNFCIDYRPTCSSWTWQSVSHYTSAAWGEILAHLTNEQHAAYTQSACPPT